MEKRIPVMRGGIGLAVASLLMLSIAPPAAAKTGVDKCSKAIGSEGKKLESTYLKVFQKCNDYYRKEVAKGIKKGIAPDLAKAGASCEKQLGKALGSGSTSTKEFDKMTQKVAGKSCADTDLQVLGHLDTATFGNRWAEFVVLTSLQTAYDQEISLVRDFVNVMQDLGNAGACPTCQQLSSAPCYDHACNFLSAGSSNANVFTSVLNTIPVDLTGSTTLKICNFSIPGVTSANEYFVQGTSGKQLNPSSIPGIGFACTKAVGAEGYITCGGSAPKVNYTTCQDHNIPVANEAGATTSGGCSGVCQASADDVGQAGTGLSAHPGVINGGVCTANTAVGASPGDAFVINTTQITVTLFGDVGPDNLPCTADDTSTPGTPAATSLTTGSASSEVLHADDGDTTISSGTVTGSPFNCANIFTSNLSGGKIVGAFPALHAIAVGPNAFDSVTSFTLGCN